MIEKYFQTREVKLRRPNVFVGLVLTFAMLISAFGPGIFAVQEAIAQGAPASIDICHATNSHQNPYVSQSPNIQNDGSLTGGHLNHTGPVWFSGIEVSWGDIIPPYSSGEFVFDGLNWDEEGEAIYNNDCEIAGNDPVTTGTITVNKEVVGSEVDENSFFLFVGEESVLNGVPAEFDFGIYTVSETPVDDFIPTFTGDCDESGNITLTEEHSVQSCTITNTYSPDEPPQEVPENTCVLPTMLEGEKIESYGLSWDSPANTLQNILNNTTYTINAVTDETGYQAWNVPVGTASVTFTATKIAAIADYTNSFGYYTNGDIDNFEPVVYGDSTEVDTTGVTSIGFALKSINHQAVTHYYATESSENPAGDDHAVVFNPADDTYIIGFEDITPLGSSDRDYNDLVVEVIIEDCAEFLAVCEPGKELIVNGSFEDPIVTNGANWDIFGSVLGWSFDWMNTDGAPAPALELHKGVNGWLSANGSQHAELDGDWYGPSDSNQGGSTKLWQEIATVPGEEYELKFSFSARPNTGEADNKLGVEIDGNDITGSTFTKSNNTNQTVWEEFTYKFTATNALTEISFEDRGTENALGTFLDDVSVMCIEESCVETNGSIVSDSQTIVSLVDVNGATSTPNTNAIPVSVVPAIQALASGVWAADVDDSDAKWIWSEDPYDANWEVDKWVTFNRTFTVVGEPQAGTLKIGSDNSYEAWINGIPVGSDASENNHSSADTWDVSSYLVNGSNTLEIRVKNMGLPGQPQENNPGGLIYNLNWTAEDCGDTPPPPPDDEDYTVTFHKFIDGEVATEGKFEIEYGTPTLNGHTISLESSNSFSDSIEVVANKTLVWSEITGGDSGVLPLGTQCTSDNQGKYILKGYTFANSFNDAKDLVPGSDASFGISVDSHVIVWNEYCPVIPPPCVEGETWADEVISSTQGTRKDGSAVLANRTNPDNALGTPDGNGNAGTGFFSLGVDGVITVKFDKYVENVDGDDLSFHEITNGRDSYPEEKASVEVSQNGVDWETIGTVSSTAVNGVAYLDFDSTGWSWIQYVRITDTTDFALHANDADGYDLDAVDATNGLCDEPTEESQPAIITVTKVVTGGGTLGVADFPLFLNLLGITSGVSTTTVAGLYTVTETGDSNYTASFDGACNSDGEINAVAGGSYECTITNTFVPPQISTTSTTGGGGGGGGSSSSRRQNPPLVLGASTGLPEDEGLVLGAFIGLPNTGRANDATGGATSVLVLLGMGLIGLAVLNRKSIGLSK